MSFIPDGNLQALLEGVLHVPQGQLVAKVPTWEQVIHTANENAYARIRASFLERGFTAAQIDLWDDGEEYQEMIGVYLALTLGVRLYDKSNVDAEKYKWWLDRLPDALLVINGEIS